VPDGLVADALVELRHKFGAVSSETQTIEGQWQQQNRDFFFQFRERAQNRFRQVSIWMTSHPIDIE